MRILLAAAIALLMAALPEMLKPQESKRALYGEDQQCGVENSTFSDGEEIVYMVYYNWGFFWTAAGMVRFTVDETDSNYVVKVSGSTRGMYDSFYRVRDTFETHLDKETLLPTLFLRDVEEGKYRKYNKFIFDQSQKKVTAFEGPSKTDLKRQDFDFEHCMHDILSIVYHLRNMDVERYGPGDSFPISVFLEEEYSLDVKVLENDSKKKIKGFGKFSTRVYEPQLIAGDVFDEAQTMTIYVSNDKNKLPVLVESPLIVGKVKAVLYDYRGLRYDLSSKIN